MVLCVSFLLLELEAIRLPAPHKSWIMSPFRFQFLSSPDATLVTIRPYPLKCLPCFSWKSWKNCRSQKFSRNLLMYVFKSRRSSSKFIGVGSFRPNQQNWFHQGRWGNTQKRTLFLASSRGSRNRASVRHIIIVWWSPFYCLTFSHVRRSWADGCSYYTWLLNGNKQVPWALGPWSCCLSNFLSFVISQMFGSSWRQELIALNWLLITAIAFP